MNMMQPLLYVAGLVLSWLAAARARPTLAKQTLLLLLSYLLYASWGAWFLGTLIGSSLLNYALGSYIRRKPTAGRLWVGILLNVALLSLYKYLPPLAGALAADSDISRDLALLLQPAGLSFWTFQALSYLFDLYREEELDPSLLEFCLYMALWPTVLSGPICRLPNMLPQFRQPAPPSWRDVREGFRRISIGILMVGLAQLLGSGLRPGEGINAGFDQLPFNGGAWDVWLLIIGFGFLLFLDFAGYSHLAIGAACVLGLRLEENFHRPYLSTTPSMFWTRWHMSLSFWIRDYLFLPLAAVRRDGWWRHLSLVISMIIFGLWHRGSLLLLLWGTYHGLLLVIHRWGQQIQRRYAWRWSPLFTTPVSWIVTFSAINIGWILFRAPNLAQATSMIGKLLSPADYTRPILPTSLYFLVAVTVSGYFFVLLVSWALDHVPSAPTEAPWPSGPVRLLREAAQFLAVDRWAWVAPLMGAVSLYVFSNLLLQRTTASRFIYMLF
jgi:alginate O-acetyltransferase complex protein AlgI